MQVRPPSAHHPGHTADAIGTGGPLPATAAKHALAARTAGGQPHACSNSPDAWRHAGIE